MGIVRLALHSLKTDLARSFFYFLSFILTTIFIFLFFNLTLNPNVGINLGKDDATPITSIATFVILIAMVCVFMANDFYVLGKSKDVSIVLMSGASVYQIGIYLFVQSAVIMIIAIPLGFVISYLLVPLVNNLFFMAFDYSGNINYIASNTYVATAIILFLEIGWCSYLNIGYCYRTSVNKMLHASVKIETYGLKFKGFSQTLYLILFIVPLMLFFVTKDNTSYLVFALIGVIGVYGIIKKILPEYIEQRQQNQSLENRHMLITLGNVKYDMQKARILIIVILMAAIVLMGVTIYTLKDPLVSMIALMSYASVMILLAVTSIFKIGMELPQRRKNYLNLYHLGYDIKDLKKIINLEMIILYGMIILIPLLYQGIILFRLLSLNLINITLAQIILVIQICPMTFCMVVCMGMYRKVLPKKVTGTIS